MVDKYLGLDVNTWLEMTFVLILVYLVLSRADGFSSAVRSISSAYTGAVKALQGR